MEWNGVHTARVEDTDVLMSDRQMHSPVGVATRQITVTNPKKRWCFPPTLLSLC